MRGSVLHRHLRLDPGEELVEADPEVGQDDHRAGIDGIARPASTAQTNARVNGDPTAA